MALRILTEAPDPSLAFLLYFGVLPINRQRTKSLQSNVPMGWSPVPIRATCGKLHVGQQRLSRVLGWLVDNGFIVRKETVVGFVYQWAKRGHTERREKEVVELEEVEEVEEVRPLIDKTALEGLE